MAADRGLSILVVDDDPSIRKIFSQLVASREPVEVTEAADAEEALRLLRQQPFDVAFVDVRMPGVGGLDLLPQFKQVRPEMETVMVSAHGTIESAVKAMRLGAADFLEKPFRLDQVTLIFERVRRVRKLETENERLRRELQTKYSARNLVGRSPAMGACNEMIDRVRREQCNVLILGESGTGKELIARAIHYDGPQRGGPFVPVDCAAMQPSLLESELFGHEKGAFTGAHARKAGLFETATGGTLFLDEVGEIPLDLQPALLRAIQEKEIRPVGGTQYRPVDARIVAATHRPLEQLVGEGKFRSDLYYRLKVVEIRVPPLRDRKGDIPLLVDHFLSRYAERADRRVTGISRDALALLQRYSWPGNIRELENALERACLLGSSELLQPEDIGPSIQDPGEEGGAPLRVRSLKDMEMEAIRILLREHSGDTSQVASILKIDRSTLYRKIKRYRISLKA